MVRGELLCFPIHSPMRRDVFHESA